MIFEDSFNEEFNDFDEEVQDQLLAHAELLEEFGPQLGRPSVDTLNDSKISKYEKIAL